MKRLFLLIMVLATLNVYSQDGRRVINYFGVDFSKVRVVGANETPAKFTAAFQGINNLMSSESEKYNVGKYFGYDVVKLYIGMAQDRVSLVNRDNFYSNDVKPLNDADIAEIVKAYSQGKDGEKSINGLVIIAEEINKNTNIGTYIVVKFDMQTKHIISQARVRGKSGGYGLRNYWAKSVLEAMKVAGIQMR